MSWSSLVDILDHPYGCSIISLHSPKVRTNSKTSGNPPHGLMKKAGVTCSKFPNKIVHCELEFFGIVHGNDALTIVFCKLGPVGAVVCRIEIILSYLFRRLIED